MHSDARLLGYEEAHGSSEIETGSRFTLGQDQAHIMATLTQDLLKIKTKMLSQPNRIEKCNFSHS